MSVTTDSPAQAAVEFFFDCGCPWSYLALGRLREAAIRTGARIIYRPVLLAEITGKGDQHPAVPRGDRTIARQRYRSKDLQDWARFCGVPLHEPDSAVVDTAWAQRGVIVAQRAGCLTAYLDGVYRARFADRRDISQLDEVTGVAERAGLEAGAFTAAVCARDTLAEVHENVYSLLHHGGFGTPTMFVGTDLYFGNDRMPLVELALVRACGMRLVMPGEHGRGDQETMGARND